MKKTKTQSSKEKGFGSKILSSLVNTLSILDNMIVTMEAQLIPNDKGNP